MPGNVDTKGMATWCQGMGCSSDFSFLTYSYRPRKTCSYGPVAAALPDLFLLAGRNCCCDSNCLTQALNIAILTVGLLFTPGASTYI